MADRGADASESTTPGPPDGIDEATGGQDAEPDDDERRSVVVASLKAGLWSDSWLLRSYAVVGTLAAGLVGLIVVLAFPVWVNNTLGSSQSVTFSRAFLLLSGLALIAALLAPLLFARRRERTGDRSRRSDFVLAATGYLLVASLYLSLVISAPPENREAPPAALAPLVEFLYGLDPTFAPVPPVVAAILVVVAGSRRV